MAVPGRDDPPNPATSESARHEVPVAAYRRWAAVRAWVLHVLTGRQNRIKTRAVWPNSICSKPVCRIARPRTANRLGFATLALNTIAYRP